MPPERVDMSCFYCGAALTPGTFFCPECGRRVANDAPAPASVPEVRPEAPETRPGPSTPAAASVDETASLRLTTPPSRPFVLLSTTGQRFEVTGRSLLGRNPRPAPEHAYESTLVVVDPGKTISKSHAELLVVADELLVVDLESGNGTVVEAPGEAPVRCEPGMPQPVPRGSRIILGRQAIDVE